MKKRLCTVLANLAAWTASLIVLVPMLVVLVNSFKSQKESMVMTLTLPEKFMFENYTTVIERGKLLSSFFNSALYATFSVLLILAVVSAASYVLSRNRSRLHRVIYYLIVLGIAMPVNNVALMKIMKATALINTRYGLIFLYVAMNIPLALFLMFGFVETLPREIDEAAVIDGANQVQIFWHVTIPNIKEMILVDTIVCVVGSFKLFDEVYIMTRGGPGYSSEVLAGYIYKAAFRQDEMGYACTIAVILFIITFILSLLQMKVSGSGKE